ncbi:MAG: carboxypeptidase regulatory-like domain-containing protein [Alphaproteobacteria bacterium]|nr:carboxypeptidase regulatory-like domain-containing protein [Alphaproteobacteria bacterium]
MISIALLALVGCAEYSLNDAPREVVDPTPPPIETDTLVLQVFPGKQTDSDGTVRAVPASVDDPPYEQPIAVELLRPFTIPGAVSGQVVNPTNRADLPSSDGAVRASLSFRTASLPGTQITSTDVDGLFEVALVSAEYQVTIAPEDPRMPMTTQTVLATSELELLDLGLDQGVPIWGRVFEDGAPYGNAEVVVLSSTGVEGATDVTDPEGWFEIRVQPGVYTVRTRGIGDGLDPVLSDVVAVGPSGARHDFEYPEIELHTVQARAVDPTGDGLSFVPYRLRASTLDAYGTNARVDIEGLSDSQGNIVTRAVAGSYTLEILPSRDLTSRRLSDVVVEAPIDLGDVVLPDLTRITGLVVDPSGVPMPDAQVRCTEVGFAGRSWSAFTRTDGRFEMIAADSPLSCAASPPGSRDDVALTRFQVTPEDQDVVVQYAIGRPIEGTVQFEGEPEEFALLEIRDQTGRVWGTGLTDDDGRFSVRVQYPQ